jgi:hypothetical protein
MCYEHEWGTYLVDHPTKRAARVCTRENVLVHEQTPNQIFILPAGPDSSDLEHKDTIVIEEVIDLAEELRVATDTDMLWNGWVVH